MYNYVFYLKFCKSCPGYLTEQKDALNIVVVKLFLQDDGYLTWNLELTQLVIFWRNFAMTRRILITL